MRAKEFITENHDNIPHTAKSALDGMVTIPDMDGFYEFYRFMTLTAGEPDYKIPATGKLRDNPTALPYSDSEMDMINKSAKRMGKSVVKVTPGGKQEAKDTHKSSPVATIKKNRFGV